MNSVADVAMHIQSVRDRLALLHSDYAVLEQQLDDNRAEQLTLARRIADLNQKLVAAAHASDMYE